jgi:hypothetical protein
MSTILPPSPPERITFAPCDFAYLSDSDLKYVKDAYDAISRKELWQPFRKELLAKGVGVDTGFMFTENPVYQKVKLAISSTPIGGLHSGCSMGFVMREMEFIALNGEPAYRLHVEQQNQTVEE